MGNGLKLIATAKNFAIATSTGEVVMVLKGSLEGVIEAAKGLGINLMAARGVGSGGIPVKDKTTASNGLDYYQSNAKHTPGNLEIGQMQELNQKTLWIYLENLLLQLNTQIRDLHMTKQPIHCTVFLMTEMVLGIGVALQIKVQIL